MRERQVTLVVTSAVMWWKRRDRGVLPRRDRGRAGAVGAALEQRVEHQTLRDLGLAHEAVEAIRGAVSHQLASSPYSFRKAGKNSTRRELIIPFDATGYVALHEIVDASNVLVLAVQHQREKDYY